MVLAAGFEEGDVPINLDLRPIDEWLPQRRHRVAKNHTCDLRPLVFEREILMAVWMQFVIRDFALHPHRAEPRLERAPNLAGELADGENFCGCLEKVARQLHAFNSTTKNTKVNKSWNSLFLFVTFVFFVVKI